MRSLCVDLSNFLTSPPLQRNEVDHVVANFQDPYGQVTRSKMCMFRRCMCVDQNGNRRVCVPPKPGWMCERKAMLLKMVS